MKSKRRPTALAAMPRWWSGKPKKALMPAGYFSPAVVFPSAVTQRLTIPVTELVGSADTARLAGRFPRFCLRKKSLAKFIFSPLCVDTLTLTTTIFDNVSDFWHFVCRKGTVNERFIIK